MLKYGFTALRDVTYNGLYLKRIFAEGELSGPRIVSSGPGLNHMACYATAGGWESLERVRFKNNWGMGCYNREDMSKAINILFSEGADQIKVFANGSGCGMTDRVLDQHFDLDDLKFIVQQAKKINETKVIAHIFDNKTAWDCLEAGVDTFEHLGFLDEELCEEMVKQDKYLVPTATLLTLWADEGMDFTLTDGFFYRDLFEGDMSEFAKLKCAEDFKLAHRKGVKIALGTDTIIDKMTPYGEFSVKELKTMVGLGMTPLEAIRAATQVGSEVLGLEEHIGTVEEGKLADLLILKANPAEDIDVLLDCENIEYVLQSGNIIVDHGQII
jgi:imidazolonepropionase-like amidohydrolase